FRARLPYLYDPWAEKLPPPPTLMHAMIAISILVEAGAVLTGIMAAFVGREGIAVAQAVSYAICATLVSIGTATFLSNRDVSLRDVGVWRKGGGAEENSGPGGRSDGKLLSSLTVGAAGGLLLGLFALGYEKFLQHLPATAELMRKSQEHMASIPNLKI